MYYEIILAAVHYAASTGVHRVPCSNGVTINMVMYTVDRKKNWQYICDHNSGIPRRILIFFAYLETGMNAL